MGTLILSYFDRTWVTKKQSLDLESKTMFTFCSTCQMLFLPKRRGAGIGWRGRICGSLLLPGDPPRCSIAPQFGRQAQYWNFCLECLWTQIQWSNSCDHLKSEARRWVWQVGLASVVARMCWDGVQVGWAVGGARGGEAGGAGGVQGAGELVRGARRWK